MIINKMPDNRYIRLTRNEYFKLCEEYNRHCTYDQLNQYDLAELVYIDDDVLTITEDMLDECDNGFYMFSEHFYQLMDEKTKGATI